MLTMTSCEKRCSGPGVIAWARVATKAKSVLLFENVATQQLDFAYAPVASAPMIHDKTS